MKEHAGEKIILIDGHSLLNRAFYGLPDLTNAEGLHTNAVYGFLNMMFRILDDENAGYLAVAFDLSAPTFRHRMYEAYKGTRKGMPDELREQVPLMQEMLRAMGVPLMMLEGYEADDLIGTVSRQCEEAGMTVTIVSGDRDLLQLASETTLVRLPKTRQGQTTVEDYHTQDVIDRYQVTPAQIIELKALMGDSSDNIPGVPGIGEKTATKLIVTYGSVEEAYAHVDEIKPARAANALREHYDLACLSRTLATIDRQSPFTLDLESARIQDLYTPEALALCRRLSFRNLLPRFEKTGQEESPACPVLKEEAQIREAFQAAAGQKTAGLSFLQDEDTLLGVGLVCDGLTVQGERVSGCLIAVDDALRAGVLSQILALPDTLQVWVAGLKNALRVLPMDRRENFYDAAVGAYLLNPLKSSYPYDEIAKDHADTLMPSRMELTGKRTDAQALQEVPEKAAQLAILQARAAFLAGPAIWQSLEQTGMRRLFTEVEMPLVYTLFAMQKAGIEVKASELKAFGEQLNGRISELEEEICTLCGRRFNILSPKQLGEVLVEGLGIKGLKKTKTGYSTAADVLEKVKDQSPVIALILEYRQLTKLKSTYAEGLYPYIGGDSRIHSTFHQTITATGRISSADPNLQNIPVRTDLGRQLRKVFVPASGCVFVDADYSQIELRVLAHMSGDEKLIEAYRQAQDIHAITASQVFHVPLDEVTPQLRRNAKAVNFGIVYGISSFGLSQDLSITRTEAQDYIERYFETYPGIRAFLDESVAFAKENGYVTTMFGRRRPVPELKSSNFMQRSFGERVAMNSPIQGTAADIIKIAMVRVHERLQREGLAARLILQVHDELIVESPTAETERVKQILREEMMGAADLKVALEIDMHEGGSWYEAK